MSAGGTRLGGLTCPGAGKRAAAALFAFGLSAGLGSWPGGERRANAASLPLDLSWTAPASCPTGEEVRREFERSVRVLPGHTPPHLFAQARVEQVGRRWVLRLHTVRDGVEGDREIEADSCASLARATSLVLALAFGEGVEVELEPGSDAQEPAEHEPAPSPSPPPQPHAQPAVSMPPSRVPREAPAPLASRPRGPLEWSASLDAGSSWGPLPGPTLAVSAGLDARHGWWGLRAQVVSWPSANSSEGPGLRTTFEGAGGSVSMCAYAPAGRVLLFSACAGLQGSALGWASSGTGATSGAAPWYAALPAVRARVRILPVLHAEAGFELATSLTRPRFGVLGLVGTGAYQETYAVPQLAPDVTLGLALDI